MAFLNVAGTRWPLTITTWQVAELRRRLDFNLGAMLKPGSSELARLADDLPLLLDVLAVLFEDDLERRGMTPRKLFEQFTEETSDEAFFAILDAYVEYLPESQRKLVRPLVDEFRSGFRGAMEKTERKAQEQLAKMEPGQLRQEFEARILAEIERGTQTPTPGG